MKRFAVLISGNGGNLQAIINAVKAGKINAKPVLVFSNKAEAFGLKRAKKAGIDTATLNPADFPTRDAFDKAVLKILKAYKVDFIVLAGYMRLLSSVFIKAYPMKIINIHPALLPSFKGAHGIEDAFKAGVKLTGVTVHFVVEEMDAGPIIAQKSVEIKSTDNLESLAARIHHAEHSLYPKSIDLFARGKVTFKQHRVIISS